jgi:hypothetical protein
VLRQISVQTNNSNVKSPASVSLKDGIATEPRIAKTTPTNPVLADPWIAPKITSNVTTKNVFSKAMSVMVKTIVVMVRMNRPNTDAGHQNNLADPENGNVPVLNLDIAWTLKRSVTTNWTVPMVPMKVLAVTTLIVIGTDAPTAASRLQLERFANVLTEKC